MGKQGRGRRLTDKERLEIIALTRQNPRLKHVDLATKYNVNESTIRKWRAQANATKIEERYAHGVAASRDTRQRGQAVRNAQFDAELYEWVDSIIKQEQDLSPARVREKARALAAQYEGMEGFKASSGWFYRFCRRYGLPCGPVGREATPKAAQGEMAVTAMIPMEVSAQSTETALAHHGSEALSTIQHEEDVTMAASGNAAAIAMSLQPPPQPHTVSEPSVNGTVAVSNASELEDKAQAVVSAAPVGPSAPSISTTLMLGVHDMTPEESAPPAAVPTPPIELANAANGPAPVAPSLTDDATATSTTVFSMAQAAATHMVHHFKDVLDPQTRLRLVRHFTRVAGEAEMYLVMDDETRLEYVKEFAATNPNATLSPPPAMPTSSS